MSPSNTQAKAFEVNFDGIVGPTHNYAGLSQDNVASQSHRHQVSSPREAALQGLAKMKALADMGIVRRKAIAKSGWRLVASYRDSLSMAYGPTR